MVTQLYGHCIKTWILDDEFDGQPWILFRVLLTSNDGEFLCRWTLRKFPIRVCFAIAVNKLQEQ